MPTLAVTKHSWSPMSDRVAHDFEDARGHALRIGVVADLGQQRDELVAAQPAHRFERAVRTRAHRLERTFHDLVAVAHAGAQPLRHLHQQRVAGAMAERVVDDLEAVQVDRQEGALVVQPPRVFDGAFHAPHQVVAIRQAGQRVEVRQVADVVFGDTPVGHVLQDAGVADAMAVFVELGLGFDVDDALARVEQRQPHVGGQHRVLQHRALQLPQGRTPLGLRHQPQHVRAGRHGRRPNSPARVGPRATPPARPRHRPARRQSKLPIFARSCARASLALLRSSSSVVREARNRYSSRPASRLHWLDLTKKSVAPAGRRG